MMKKLYRLNWRLPDVNLSTILATYKIEGTTVVRVCTRQKAKPTN